MKRREALRALGATAALSFLPRNASAAWAMVRERSSLALAVLTPQQAALVNAVADTIIPRTDTPSASDVNVVAWVDVVAAEYYADDERTTFLSGLDAMDAYATTSAGKKFAALDQAGRDSAVGAIEKMTDRRNDPARAYWRLKGLVIHGYFTSERVQKQVLKTEIMPGRFVGDAPMVAGSADQRAKGPEPHLMDGGRL